MHPPPLGFDEVLGHLEADVAATVGDAHRAIVQKTAALVRELEIGDPADKVVDDVQQFIHDTFVDTTWPTCPKHGRHPLWYLSGAWWCEQDDVAIAPLGSLARVRE